MPRVLHIILLVPALVGWAAADVPRKAPITKYAGLWTNSPFTSKPPPPEAGPVVNPLEDYTLAGVSPVSSGYRVTLLNKKKPEERIIVESDKPREGFKILGVTRKAGDPLGTVVRMQSGSVTGTVAFDETLLTLAPPPAAKPQVPPGVVPPPQLGQPPQPGQQPLRQPRPRVVPPPTPNPKRPTSSPAPSPPSRCQARRSAHPKPTASGPPPINHFHVHVLPSFHCFCSSSVVSPRFAQEPPGVPPHPAEAPPGVPVPQELPPGVPVPGAENIPPAGAARGQASRRKLGRYQDRRRHHREKTHR